MKNIVFTLALLISFNSTLAQNIDKLRKRELKELANTQKKQLTTINSQIVDQNVTIVNQKTTIENLYDNIKELNQIKIQLENFKLSSLDLINKLNTKNAVIPSLENEIIKLTDSINRTNNLLSILGSQDSISINQNSSSSSYGFLNNLYLGNSYIQNQTFRLVPAGIIAINHIRYGKKDNYGYNYNRNITQFIPMAELNIGIEEKKKTQIKNSDAKKDYKQVIKNNYKMIPGNKLYNLFPGIFPTFSFLKGKLLTITNENVPKDFLFSIKKDKSEGSLVKQLGQKGTYFSLTDDNEKEYLLELVVINDEVYLRINTSGENDDKNSLEKFGMKWSVSSKYESEVVNYEGFERRRGIKIDYGESDYFNSTSYKGKFFIECDQTYISTFLIKSLYESAVRIDPEMFLFKLEEI
tara:strand:+ start:27796 stop:29025 length:1230 start_codon:yes stop_codon:yes gene_type:complete